MKTKWFTCLGLLLSTLLVMNAGCGGGGSPIVQRFAPPQAISVTLSQNSAMVLDMNQSQTLTATVKNDPNNRGVTWTVACAPGVTACGTMANTSSPSGTANKYSAPASVNTAEMLTVTATSASDGTKFASLQITVNPTPTLVKPSPPVPPGNVGRPFALDLMQYIQGGSSPFNCNIKSGTLPAGLSLSGTGITGTPTAVTASLLSVFDCADSGNPAISLTVTVSIIINPPLPITISPAAGALPSGTVGTPYRRLVCWWRWGCHWVNIVISAAGGVQPYVFSWTASAGSSTPPGLSLDSVSGTITGTPTAAAIFNFLVTVADSESPPKHATANYSITVVAPSPSPSPSPSASP